jgi:DUF4097 and DUF4098 domain-containing protein YvlB
MRLGLQFSSALLLTALVAGAQMRDNQKKDLDCSNRNSRRNGSGVCDVREMAGVPGRISVDAGRNGGVAVKGWSRGEVLVRAKVEAWADTEQEAQSIASQVRVIANSGRVMAEGPNLSGRNQSWAVSFELFVPHRTDLELTAENGGIHLSDLHGDIQFQGRNGGVHMSRLGGRVRGSTVNGGVHAELEGQRWDGTELDVKTTNGGVHLEMPENYSARFEASTNNGRVHLDMPGIKTDRETRQIASTLGSGGALVRLVTTNGGVHVGRK